MEIIPAIDLINNTCVRLTKGDYTKKTSYDNNPLEVAKRFEDFGFKKLHLVDLDGAREKKPKHLHILCKIAENTDLEIDFSGGLRTKADVENSFNKGAKKVSIGSLAVKDSASFISLLEDFGSERIILSSDVKNELIAISGWEEDTQLNIFDFINSMLSNGLKHVICTDISVDGMLSGSNLNLYKKLLSKYPNLNVIASGGIGSHKDLINLEEAGIKSVIVGKALYEQKITDNELKRFIC